MTDDLLDLGTWAVFALTMDIPLDVLADCLPYSGAGEDEASALIDALSDAGWVIVPTPGKQPRTEREPEPLRRDPFDDFDFADDDPLNEDLSE